MSEPSRIQPPKIAAASHHAKRAASACEKRDPGEGNESQEGSAGRENIGQPLLDGVDRSGRAEASVFVVNVTGAG
jgi:hypothetical protein